MEKLTKKYVMSTYKNMVEVGYCELQELLTFANQIGYTAGVYGWNASIYQVDPETVIVTGYRPFGNISTNYALCKKYADKAIEAKKEILNCEKLRDELDKLIDEFVDEILKIKKSKQIVDKILQTYKEIK